MRVLIVSDVHADPWALRAVEADARPFDHVLFAGDAVDYGPDTVRCVDWLDQQRATASFTRPERAAGLLLERHSWPQCNLHRFVFACS
jgi:hypothetical protein